MSEEMNQAAAAFAQRDLWWEARQKTEKYRGSPAIQFNAAVERYFRPIKRLPYTVTTLGTENSLYCVDLNKYRPNVNVEMLIDQGVQVFMLRVGGPTRWVYANWAYEIDSTFTTYYKRIRDYAKAKGKQVWIIGYGVHNAWSNEEGNYLGLDPQVKWLKEATRNHLCDLYCWDDEVGECWKDGGNKTITPVNLIKSISICMEQTYNEMEVWEPGRRKMIVHYSANWFMKKYAMIQYQTWLSNNDKDINTRHFMTWRAWLPVVFSTPKDLITQIFDQFITPTGTQENSYLRMADELAADLWQGTFTAMGPWCEKKSDGAYLGIDASLGYGPSATVANFMYNANLKPLVVTDATPPGAVSNLAAVVSGSQVTLTWAAATDNIAVAGYRIRRDGAILNSVMALTFLDQNVPNGTHVYTVEAFDAAGNIGAPSSTTVTVGTIPPGQFVTMDQFNNHHHETGGPVNQ